MYYSTTPSRTTRVMQRCVTVIFLTHALTACVGSSGSFYPATRNEDSSQMHGTPGTVSGFGSVPAYVSQVRRGSTGLTARLLDGTHGAATDDSSTDTDPSSEDMTETNVEPLSLRLAEHARSNPEAADLLDHWGHRRVQTIVEGLSLRSPASETDAADLLELRTAAQMHAAGSVAPDLHDNDEVRILGTHRSINYGRWTGGSADTLSIEFDLSGAGPAMQDNPAFRAMLERAGKAWSRRIADTWTAWDRPKGDLKGFLVKDVDPGIQVRVGEGGEISYGLEIDVRDEDLDGATGWSLWGTPLPGDSWQPRFGSIEVDREYLQETYEARLFSTLTHEIGHTLGAWRNKRPGLEGEFFPYTDTEAGTWTGPNVVAIHGGPAPFREKSASEFDFKHSGVCTSIMAYCRHDQALRPLGPQAIDFAFLADLGITLAEETSRPETYGLAGWTDYVGFTVSVSRDLRFAWTEPQPHYNGDDYHWQRLDVTDLLQVGVDAFGYGSTGDPRLSYAEQAPYGAAHYTGGLLGAALYRTGLPPVTGDATLEIDLDSLDGMASFTSLSVYPEGIPEVFGSGSLHYPFEVSDNSILGTETRSTLAASFYGPQHEDVAGTLRDPHVGLLASFGATADERPGREDVMASADHMRGIVLLGGSADSADDGWYEYRCGTDSVCESRHWGWESSGWTDWTATDRASVLAATAGWSGRSTARPVEDLGFLMVSQQLEASTDGARGRHVIDGYAGTLEYAGFGVGFEATSRMWAASEGPPSDFDNLWVGFQGALSGSSPDETATWFGRMLGYDRGTVPQYENRFVEGLATVTFSLAENEVDVAFSQIASRDRQRSFDDFGYENVRVESDGTFQEGKITGAFFGSSNEEVAGQFDNNNPRILGSFGARRIPDAVTPNQEEIDTALARIVEVEDTLRVGEDIAPPVDQLTAEGDYNGVAVSSFVPDTESEDLAADDMGSWDDTSFHLRGDLSFAGGAAAFGVASGDDLVQTWVSGPEPRADLADNSALSGTVSWNGALLGISSSGATVGGNARLAIELSTLEGQLDFTSLEDWGTHEAPQASGNGTVWGDGSLQYSIGVQGNSFYRSGGDEGSLAGAFFGPGHEAMGGTLERTDLAAGFSGARSAQ